MDDELVKLITRYARESEAGLATVSNIVRDTARIVEIDVRASLNLHLITHSMFAYPHFWLWHALFDGTRFCRCWHSREMKEMRDGG